MTQVIRDKKYPENQVLTGVWDSEWKSSTTQNKKGLKPIKTKRSLAHVTGEISRMHSAVSFHSDIPVGFAVPIPCSCTHHLYS